jgi:hypothetical protein
LPSDGLLGRVGCITAQPSPAHHDKPVLGTPSSRESIQHGDRLRFRTALSCTAPEMAISPQNLHVQFGNQQILWQQVHMADAPPMLALLGARVAQHAIDTAARLTMRSISATSGWPMHLPCVATERTAVCDDKLKQQALENRNVF